MKHLKLYEQFDVDDDPWGEDPVKYNFRNVLLDSGYEFVKEILSGIIYDNIYFQKYYNSLMMIAVRAEIKKIYDPTNWGIKRSNNMTYYFQTLLYRSNNTEKIENVIEVKNKELTKELIEKYEGELWKSHIFLLSNK